MAIINRSLGDSQKQVVYQAVIEPTATGLTYGLALIPYPATLVAVAQAAIGLSGAPNHSLWLNRFVVGSGITSISFGNSFVVTGMGTSGMQSFSLPLATTFPLLAGDLLILSTAAANTSVAALTVTTVIRALQDIISIF